MSSLASKAREGRLKALKTLAERASVSEAATASS